LAHDLPMSARETLAFSRRCKMLPSLSNRFGGLTGDIFAWPSLAGAVADDCKVRNDGDVAKVEIDLPGFSEEEIDVVVENGVLAIHAENTERGRRRRLFRLLDTADPESIRATLKNGVLTVSVGKSEQAKERKIEIRSD